MEQLHRKRHLLPPVDPVPGQALAAFHLAVGAAILSGGVDRFKGPGWAGARALAHPLGEGNAWWLWGSLLAFVGGFMFWAWPWLERHHPAFSVAAVAAGSVPLFFLVAGFFYAVHVSPFAATSGIGAYGSVAIAHVHLAATMLSDGHRARRRQGGHHTS